MKKITLLFVLCTIIFSCEKDNLEIGIEKENSSKKPQVIQLPLPPGVITDFTGTIEIYSGTVSIYDSNDPNLFSGTAYVPEGFVCVGGGAHVINVYDDDPGALLTMSAPLDNGQFNGWRAEAKAHIEGNSIQPWYLQVHIIGMRLRSNSGAYIPVEELRNSMQLVSNTSSLERSPSTFVTVSNGYKLIGGGAIVNWSGPGNLLTESYPEGNSWLVKSKDHTVESPATITSYAIGIKNTIPNFGSLAVNIISDCDDNDDSLLYHNQADTYLDDWQISNSLIACPGAKVSSDGAGVMLETIAYQVRNIVRVFSRAHLIEDNTGTTCAYAVGIKKGL